MAFDPINGVGVLIFVPGAAGTRLLLLFTCPAIDMAALFAALRRKVREDTFDSSLAWIAYSLGRLSDAG